MTMMMMIATVVLVLALSVTPSEAMTHRRASGTELYRVQPTQKVMSSLAGTSSNNADFEKINDDAKRALHELMTGARHLEVGSSMEYLSLSFAPIMSMSMSPPSTTIITMSPLPVSDVLEVSGTTTTNGAVSSGGGNNGSGTGSNVAAVNRSGGAGENGTNQFNKPATISVSVFLLIAAMAVTALVVRKYKRAVMMMTDDQSVLSSPTVFTMSNEAGENMPIV